MASYENVISELEGIKVSFNQQCESTAQSWSDGTKDRFYGEFVNGYSDKIDKYIGQVKETGTFLEIREKEMKALLNILK